MQQKLQAAISRCQHLEELIDRQHRDLLNKHWAIAAPFLLGLSPISFSFLLPPSSWMDASGNEHTISSIRKTNKQSKYITLSEITDHHSFDYSINVIRFDYTRQLYLSNEHIHQIFVQVYLMKEMMNSRSLFLFLSLLLSLSLSLSFSDEDKQRKKRGEQNNNNNNNNK